MCSKGPTTGRRMPCLTVTVSIPVSFCRRRCSEQVANKNRAQHTKYQSSRPSMRRSYCYVSTNNNALFISHAQNLRCTCGRVEGGSLRVGRRVVLWSSHLACGTSLLVRRSCRVACADPRRQGVPRPPRRPGRFGSCVPLPRPLVGTTTAHNNLEIDERA